jgi:dipeptidase E
MPAHFPPSTPPKRSYAECSEDIDDEQCVPVVQETDVLLANGGDALYLSHWMRQSGLADLLPSLRAVWVGLSGGSMVMAPNVGEEPIRWRPRPGVS